MKDNNIVILGAGFAGIRAALDLTKNHQRLKNRKIIVIDKNSYHLFTPWLYSKASIGANNIGLKIPLQKIFKNHAVDILRGEVVKINRKKKLVHLTSGQQINYEYLILATGSQVNTYNIPGIAEHAFFLKTYEDAIGIRKELQARYLEFLAHHEPGELYQVIIGGGGFTGVELAGELHNQLKQLSCQHENCEDTFIIKIIDAGNQLLGGKYNWLSMQAQARLGRYRHIEIILKSKIQKITASKVFLSNGDRLEFELFIWTGGVRGHEMAQACGLEVNQSCQIPTMLTTQTNQDPAIFAVGDISLIINPKTGERDYQIIADAYLEGALAAENIIRLINRQSPKNYRHQYFGQVVPIRGQWAVSNILGIPLKGWLAYQLHRIIYLRYFLMILPPPEAWKRWRGSR